MSDHRLEFRKCIIKDVYLGFNPFGDAFLPTINYPPIDITITFVDATNHLPVCNQQMNSIQQCTNHSSSSETQQLVFHLDNILEYQELCDLVHTVLKEDSPEDFPGHKVNDLFIRDTTLRFRQNVEALQYELSEPPIDFVIDLSESPINQPQNSNDKEGYNVQTSTGTYCVTLSIDNPKEYRDLCNIGLRLLNEPVPTKFAGHEVTLILVKQKSPFADILGAIGNKEGTQFVIPNFHIDNDIISEMTVDPFSKKQTEVVIQHFGCF